MKKIFAIVALSAMLSACASLGQADGAGKAGTAPLAGSSQQAPIKTETPIRKAKVLTKTKTPQPEDLLPTPELSDDLLFQLLSAEIAFQRGRWPMAYGTLLGSAQQTRDPRLAKRAAEMALAMRRPIEALAAVRLWTKLAPHSDEALQNYLGLSVLSNDMSELQPLMTRRLADAQPQARGQMVLRMQGLLGRAKDKAGVLTLLLAVLAPYPDLIETHLALAQAAHASGDMTRARDEANQALKLKPDSELAILTLAQVTPDANESMKLITGFLKAHPKAHEVRVAYARGLVEQKQFEQARSQFQILLRNDQNDLATLLALGVLDVQTNRLPEAETHLKRYLEVLATQPEDERDPTQALLLLSQIAEERKDIPLALDYLEQIEPTDEAYVNVQIRRGRLMARGGDIDGARKALQQAQSEAGNGRELLQLIQGEAQILYHSERHQDAADVLSAALKRFPESTDLLYDYAMASNKTGNYQGMETALRKIIDLAPNNQQAYNALGYSLADRNIRLPEAITLIETALQLAPEDPFIVDSLGWAEFRMGNLEKAEKQLRRAYDLRPDPEIGIHLGEILWTGGKQDEARQLWREAQSKDPKNDVLKDTLTRLKVQL